MRTGDQTLRRILFGNRVKTYIFAVIILGVVTGFVLGFYLGRPEKGEGYWIWSNTITVTVYGEIHIEVSPVEYPVAGQSWTIFVYSTNVTSEGVFLSPLPNSTVAVSVNDNGQSKVYHLLVDAKGQAEFQYLPSYTDVAFQAFEGDYQSEKIVISKHYVSSNVIETMLLVNGSFSLATGVCTGLAKLRHKIKKTLTVLFIVVIALFAVISLLAFYSRLFLETPWGYPEIVIENYVSLDTLKYATIFGVASLSILVIATIVIGMKQPSLESWRKKTQH
jgi:phage shock protein PspC (stress-responsive transcriptional regulator)